MSDKFDRDIDDSRRFATYLDIVTDGLPYSRLYGKYDAINFPITYILYAQSCQVYMVYLMRDNHAYSHSTDCINIYVLLLHVLPKLEE